LSNPAAAAAVTRNIGRTFAPLNYGFAFNDLIQGYDNSNYWQMGFAAGDMVATTLLLTGIGTGPAALYLTARGVYQMADAVGVFDDPNSNPGCVR
jgi:hypothetical protein